MRRISAALSLFLLAATGCMQASATFEGTPIDAPAQQPRLVVVIAVDQLRGDMLDRHRDNMRHGYARLMRGAWFVNGFQDHGITETAPGHASMLSGRFPRSTGIVSNNAGVYDPNHPLLDASPREPGASPELFRGTTLFDWLAARHPQTRALSVSFKDRSAILMVGRARQDVYWYSINGSFTTSRYYRDSLPAWVREFNARRIPHRYAGAQWQLALDPSRYSEPDSMPFEGGGMGFTFPHQFPADTATTLSYIRFAPAGDSLTALFALEGVRRMELGTGPHPDLLAVSFSSTDRIGHQFGPDSREAHDNQVRLDHTLGWFIDSLYSMRDSGNVVIALTGDHGVQPNRHLARARGWAQSDQALLVSLVPQVAAVRSALRARGVDTLAFRYDRETVALDRAELVRGGVNPDSLLNAFAREARGVRGVARVDRLRDLRRADPAADPVARRWSHQIPAESRVELTITLTRYSLWYDAVATHGSPYDEDAHVPIIFYGPGTRPGRYTEFARVVDIAPTLAALARVRTLEPLDGAVLVRAVR